MALVLVCVIFLSLCLSLAVILTFYYTSPLAITHTHTLLLSHSGPYAVWYGAISPPGAHPPHDDADGYPGSSRGSAATHAPDSPQPHPCFLHHTFFLPGTSTRYLFVLLTSTPLLGGLRNIDVCFGSSQEINMIIVSLYLIRCCHVYAHVRHPDD